MKSKTTDSPAHTPGPWHVRQDREFYQDHPQPYCIASVPKPNEENPSGVLKGKHRWVCRLFDSWDDQARADAALISAAPELMAACQKLLAFTKDILPQSRSLVIQDIQGLNEGLITAESAIKKATQPKPL